MLVLVDGVDAVLDEVWVDVQAGAAFNIEGVRPNPTSRGALVSFSVDSSTPASIEVFDVRGRRVVGLEVPDPHRGTFLLRLDEAASLPAGIYLLRLRQGEGSVATPFVVVR